MRSLRLLGDPGFCITQDSKTNLLSNAINISEAFTGILEHCAAQSSKTNFFHDRTDVFGIFSGIVKHWAA